MTSYLLFRMRQLAEFGWPCGGTFISNRAKCWTDPKTGKRLKVPVNHQAYQKIKDSKSKASQKLYRDREQAIREVRRAAVPGWKKPTEHIRDISKLRPAITVEDEEILKRSELKGTEKQVNWADILRRKALIDAKKEAILYAQLYTKDNPLGEKLSNKDFGEVEKLLTQYVASKKDARFWIDNRNLKTQEDILSFGMQKYVQQLAKNNDPRLPNDIKERALKGIAYSEEREAKANMIKKEYEDIKLSDVGGTEKQIKYAKDLQKKLLKKPEIKEFPPRIFN